MFLLVFVYFALLRLTSALQFNGFNGGGGSSSVRPCRTPDFKPGNCVVVDECSELITQAHQTGSFSILRRSNCGFVGSTPKVCCPKTDDFQTESPETTTSNWWQRPVTTTTTTTMPTTVEEDDWGGGVDGDSITSHRNYYLLPQSCGPASANKILGGDKTDIEEYPWMTLLNYRYFNGRTSFGCGGSLISDRYILTAAHCVKGLQNMKLVSVRLGEYDLSQDVDCVGSMCSLPVQDIQLEEVIPHRDYNPKVDAQYNDIALLRLKTRADLNQFVQPICLPPATLLRKNYDGVKLTVAGWGKTSNDPGTDSDVKLKVDVPVVSPEECKRFYSRKGLTLRTSQMCAGGEPGKDSCQGDSGGPLMSEDVVNSNLRYHVTGIVSFGPKCGTFPAVYTKVAEFIPWILDNMKP